MAVARKHTLKTGQMAAVLMMSLGEDAASDVLKHMGPKEVQRLGVAMTNIGDVTKEVVSTVLDEFMDTVSQHTSHETAFEYIIEISVTLCF